MKCLSQLLAVLTVGSLIFTGLSCSNAKNSSAPPVLQSQTNSPVPVPGQTASSEIKGEPGQPQTVDVFSGKPVNRNVFADRDGERLYFCCDESKKMFQANPQATLQKIHAKSIILEKTPQ